MAAVDDPPPTEAPGESMFLALLEARLSNEVVAVVVMSKPQGLLAAGRTREEGLAETNLGDGGP